MSVLIEACCLVVKQLSVDLAFPGGTDAFTARAQSLDPVRYVVSDGHLVAVSINDPQLLTPLLSEMVDAGLVATHEDGFGDFAYVDMEMGETISCAWLETEAHRHGFRVASHVGMRPTAMARPTGWTPQESWKLTRSDLRDAGPERVLSLGTSEDGSDALLDLQTGHVVRGTRERSPIVSVREPEAHAASIPGAEELRFAAAQRLLGERGISYRIDTEQGAITILLALDELASAPESTSEDAQPVSAMLHEARDEDGAVKHEGKVVRKRLNLQMIVEQIEAQLSSNSEPLDDVSFGAFSDADDDDDDEVAPDFDEPHGLPADDDCALRISVMPGEEAEQLSYYVVLPRVLREQNRTWDLVLDKITRDAEQGTEGTFDVDTATGTMGLRVSTVRAPGQTWEEAVERGFTRASRAATQVTRDSLAWC